MKKITIIFTIILMSIYNIANAASESNFKNYWYFGSKLGLSQYDHIKLLGKDIDNKEYTIFNKIGNGIFFGYQANNFLGLEIGFDWLGVIKKNIEDKNITNFFESKGIQLTSNFRYPIFKNLYLYSRLGGLFVKSNNKQYSKYNSSLFLNNSYYSASPLLAIGGDFKINDHISSRAEYQFVQNIGNNNDDDLGQKTNNSMFTISIVYTFVDKYHLPSITNLLNKARNKFYNNYGKNNILSKIKVYFKFDNSILEKKDKIILNKKLNNNIKNKNLSTDSKSEIVILGHSDYLEKDTNNILSKKRAEEVAKYLTSKNKNLLKKIIFIKGLGSNLLINEKCKKIKNYELLKKCLIIDRYVEIKILKIPQIKKKHVFYKNGLMNHNYDDFNKFNNENNFFTYNNYYDQYKNNLIFRKKLEQMFQIPIILFSIDEIINNLNLFKL
ncbi:OmpA family protein [Enterobacteriaceae endosymbiont of Donacia sparganii]|uniref:OmpA family protein n=1 Tax=Enterobacteriaceae endosymbiont of Donacia sparganii TaxID=2675785 RepID=UPI00144A2B7A|nr:OmpA family protein [Enterobacteriaceae endosymbiont of Donacia sparganii]QJC35666.1 OmpA family protein [Enterobacteriaceae endosymbiont of Donacia sparganii]